MINIELSTPIKLSGRESLKIKFNYNEEILAAIKSFSPAIWHKTLGIWEVGENYLHAALDTLCFYDSIDLTINLPEIREISFGLTEEEINSFKVKPYDHQIEAINYGLTKPGWLNLSSMGLGKSLEAMYLAETLYRRKEIEHCLIVCGVDSLRTNWKSEIKKFSNLSSIVLGEYTTKTGSIRYKTVSERAEQLINPISEFFIIVNAATIRDDKIVEAFKKSKNKIGMIVVDECHRISNKQSAQGNNLLKLDAKYKVAMSGSLVTNNPESCYLPLSWTHNDHATLTNFKAAYCKFGGPGSFNQYQVTGYQNLDLLQDELNSCSLRRTFDQVRGNMPTKNIEFETVEMSPEHSKFYDAIKQGVKEEADKVELHTGNLLALTTRLRQATAAPSVLTTNNIDSSKVDRAVEIAEDILNSGEKLVIFSTFLEPCDVLSNKLKKYNPLIATGNISDDIAQRNIDNFRNSDNYNLLIGTFGKLSTGYSMPEAHYSLMIDTPWTYYAFAQACDRIYRITSDQPVFIKVLTCAGTIDEHVQRIVETKKDLQDYLIDNKENSISENLQTEMKNILLNL